MPSRLESRRARRKVRWLRLFLVLFAVIVMLTAVSGAAWYAYLTLFDADAASFGQTLTPGSNETVSKRVNILILGVDDGDSTLPDGGPRRSDTMMVVSIDPHDGTVNLLSIPRDTRVAIPGHQGLDKITHAFAYGGPLLAVRTVQDFLQVPIQYYLVMNWQGFIEAIDVLGGVDLFVEDDMNYDDPYANLSIHLKKGYQHLDGKQAGEYVRYRHDELGDIGRVQRQQKFIKSIDEQMFSMGTIFHLPSLTATLRQHVSTNMSGLMMLKVANTLKDFKSGSLHAELLPGDFATIDGLSYWVPNKDQTRDLVRKMFFPAGVHAGVRPNSPDRVD